MKSLSFFSGLAAALFFTGMAPAQFWNDFDVEPHSYRSRKLTDPVSVFMERVNGGAIPAFEEEGKELVKKLLEEFKIPVSSQVFVFTKTSLQRDQVSSDNPRALYFNEDAYLGWMPGGRVEIASIDPLAGPVFWFQRPLGRKEDLLFRRTGSCLGCHAGSATNYLPGLLGQSVYPLADGRSAGSIRTFERVGHNIPYEQRWGGWMVTGAGHEALNHMGNALAVRDQKGLRLEKKTAGQAASDLSVFFDPSLHLIEGSDILAMLAHDHQISAHYRINEAQYRMRQVLFDEKLDPDSGREVWEKLPSAHLSALDTSMSRFLKYFLFADEPALKGEIQDGGVYRKDFFANKRVSRHGLSLKDLDLKTRLLKHRLSWMIYSNAFEGIPRAFKEEFYHRLWNILTRPGGVAGFEYLGAEEKAAIAEILTDTKDGLPDYWKI